MKKLFKFFIATLLCTICLFPANAEVKLSKKELEKSQKQLNTLLPNPKKLDFKIIEGPTFYNPTNLYEYINGAAESYHQYHFHCLAALYIKKNGVEMNVDIYDMGADINAFGIYSAERSPTLKFNKIGVQGYADEMSLNFFQQQYYVKLSAFGPKEKTPRLLKRFGKRIAKKIGKENALPAEFKSFPVKNRIKNSEKYIKKSAFGLGFLENTFSMQYNLEDNASTLSLSIASSPTQAKEWLGQVEDHYKRMRAEINPVHSLSPDAFAALSKYEPKTMVMQEKNYLITLNNAVDGAVDFILDLKKKLKEKAISK